MGNFTDLKASHLKRKRVDIEGKYHFMETEMYPLGNILTEIMTKDRAISPDGLRANPERYVSCPN